MRSTKNGVAIVDYFLFSSIALEKGPALEQLLRRAAANIHARLP